MSIVIVLNIVLAALVVVAIVSGLAWSVSRQGLAAPISLRHSARRRQRPIARTQLKPVQNRA